MPGCTRPSATRSAPDSPRSSRTSRKAHPDAGSFADLPVPPRSSRISSRIERTPFFDRMRFLTVLGLLALPSYGGNRDKAGWKMVGFVDQHGWEPPFGHYDATTRASSRTRRSAQS